MASKPTSVPTWAYGMGASITVPMMAKMSVGWLVAEKPPAQYFNWQWNLVGQWTDYLNDIENHSLIWLILQSFNYGIVVTQNTVNVAGIRATGNGTGWGVDSHGGTGSGGLKGTAGVGSATAGIYGIGDLTGVAGGAGVRGDGGIDAAGGEFNGQGIGPGVAAVGGATGAGLTAQGGSTSGVGVNATGGPGSVGVRARAGTGNATGLQGVGSGTGHGVDTTASAGNALRAVSSGAGDAIQATAGGGKAINAVGLIETTADLKVGNSAFIARRADSVTLPNPTILATEYTAGMIRWARYTWILTMGVNQPTFMNGKGVYALDRIADGDAYITWDIIPANLTEAQLMGGMAQGDNISTKHCLIASQDNSGVGGRLRFRIQTLDDADVLILGIVRTTLMPF